MILDKDGIEISSKDKKEGPIIIGLDLALRNTGFSVFDGKLMIDHGTIKTKAFPKPKKLKPTEYFQDQIEHDLKQIVAIDSSINSLVVQYNPVLMVIEVPTFSQSQSSALSLGYCRAGIMRQVLSPHVETILLNPNCCKAITGNPRRTTKEDVRDKVLCSGFISLGGADEHVIDSVAAVLYYRSTLPEDHPLHFKITEK